jgi:hypothetical protein
MLSNHASTCSATMLRHAQQPCFDMLSNHASTCSATMLRHAQQPCFDRPATLRWEGAAKIQRSPQQSVLLVRNALLGRWIFDTRVEMEWITKPCERITCGETIRPVAGEVLILFCYSYILRRKFSCFTKETPLQTFQS